jgi:RNA polymerase sigma-70 factor (ECF subfamily)
MQDFSALYVAKRDRVVAAVAVLTRDVARAEDATQEAFRRAYERWARVGKLDRPDLWVVRVASNLAISSFHRSRRERELLGTRLSPAALDSVTALVDSEWLKWGLDQLTEKQRMALVLRYAEDWEIDDIAAKTESTPAALRQQLMRARNRLRQTLMGDRA